MSPVETLENLLKMSELMAEAMQTQAEALKRADDRMGRLIDEVSVNRVLITMMAKDSGMEESRFMSMVEKACEVSAMADSLVDAAENSNKEAADIISNMMKGGAREH